MMARGDVRGGWQSWSLSSLITRGSLGLSKGKPYTVEVNASLASNLVRVATVFLQIYAIAGFGVAVAQVSEPNATPGKLHEPLTPGVGEYDYRETPYTAFGEYHEAEEERNLTNFFQNGRFFGVSVHTGVESALGNRGSIFRGGIPVMGFQLHYWFDFQFALQLGLQYVQHYYADGTARVDANITHAGVDFKYYVDTTTLPAPIAFAGPYFLLGFGSYTKVEINRSSSASNDSDTVFGLTGGMGLEFTLSPKHVFVDLEGRLSYVAFSDQGQRLLSGGAEYSDRTGPLTSLLLKIMYCW